MSFTASRVVYSIYLLFDDATRRAYIGRTNRPLRTRVGQHHRVARDGDNRPLYRWLRAVTPTAVVIGTAASVIDADNLERRWIAIGRAAFRYELLNTDAGGSGEVPPDFSLRVKAGQEQSGFNARRARVAVAAGASDELRAARRGFTTENWNDPEIRAKRVNGIRLISADPEFRKRRGAAIAAAWTPASRAAKSERAKAMWTDPEHRAKTGAAIGAALRKLWADPDRRAGRLASLAATRARKKAAGS